jgi:hypothetical protein
MLLKLLLYLYRGKQKRNRIIRTRKGNEKERVGVEKLGDSLA